MVKGLIAGFGDLPLEDTLETFDPRPVKLEPLAEELPSKDPSIHLIAGLGGSAVPTAGRGTQVTVVGSNFCGDPTCPPVVVEAGGVVLADNLAVDPKGGFQFTFVVEGSLGARLVTATQALDPKNVLSHSVLLVVPVVDAEEDGLEVELIRPACVNTPDVVISGQALGERETSTRIARISFTVNDGPETIVCQDCRRDPVFAFAAPLPIDCGENVVRVMIVEEGTGQVAQRTRMVRRDSKPPEIHCPAPISTACNDPSGAVVTFDVTATDGCTAKPSVFCDPPSGSVFPLGTTIVKCLAVDDCGNEAHCEFLVTVQCHAKDQTPPKIVCPSDLTKSCGAAGGTPVSFEVLAVDDFDPAPVVMCKPPSGSLFPVGETTVNCLATDAVGNKSQCSFKVRVIPGSVTIDAKYILRWDCGVLEDAASVSGPWESVNGAANGVYQASPGDQRRFFRSRR